MAVYLVNICLALCAGSGVSGCGFFLCIYTQILHLYTEGRRVKEIMEIMATAKSSLQTISLAVIKTWQAIC